MPRPEPYKSEYTKEEVLAYLNKAHDVLSELCKNPRSWRMCIPVDAEDTDIVIGQALHAAIKVIERI